MEMQKEATEKTLDFKYVLLIFQIMTFAVVLIGAFIIKTVGGEFYKEVKSEYIKCFEEETRLEDIFDERDDFSSFEEDYKVIVE